MSPRLLSLLTMLEGALRDREAPAMSTLPSRLISFQRGIARLIFGDKSGDITVQSFTLADGQLCIKMQLHWTGCPATVTHALYPQGNFQWEEQVGLVADTWTEGPPPSPLEVDSGTARVAV